VELPEVQIGTTQVAPMIYPSVGNDSPAETVEKDTSAKAKLERGDTKASGIGGAGVQQLDFIPEEGRPARWERYDVIRWRIEGMR
jgi:hypothetical protein